MINMNDSKIIIDKTENDKKIEKLLSPNLRMDVKFEDIFSDVKSTFNMLILVNQKNYSNSIMSLMRRFTKEEGNIVYVAVNKTFEKLKSQFLKENINIKNVVFIDMVTELVKGQKSVSKNVFYLPSPSNLNDLMEVIDKNIQNKKGDKILLFDSISTMFVYFEPLSVEKMIHSLIGKLNKFSVDGIFLMAKSKEESNMIQTIGQFCDKVVEMDNL